jgi:hypothetical protein
MNLEFKFISNSLLPCPYFLCSDKHLKSDGFTQVKIEYKKRGA